MIPKMILIAIPMILALTSSAHSVLEPMGQQEKGQWTYVETRDKMTDKLNSMVAVKEATDPRITLTVNKGGENVFIVVDLPPGLVLDLKVKYLDTSLRLSLDVPYKEAVQVQWRVDEAQMREFPWGWNRDGAYALNNESLLKAMTRGKLLRLRLSELAAVLEFDVRGLGYYLPKLGITVETSRRP
jgi:hypothetical protein